MDSHHIFSKIQMVDGVSFFLFGDFPLSLKNKKKAFYKPIALSYAINSFFFSSGFSPKRSTVLVPLDCTSLSYYSSQVSACTLLSFSPFSSEKKLFALFFSLLVQTITQEISFVNRKIKNIIFVFNCFFEENGN